MDPTQTPRAVVESNASRPLSMVKQSRTVPSGYHIRPPGSPSGLPRYPVNNGAAGGPRLSGRPPPELQRHDSRSTLSLSPGQPNQFVQQRPSYIPPRSQITPVISPATFPRALLPPNNPATLSNPSNQFPIRYPNTAPSSNIRGPSYSPSGQRPPFNPQQFLRPQRPGLFESRGGVPLQTRFGVYPQATDNRHASPRIIPENVTNPPQNRDNILEITKTMASSVDEYNPQTIRPESLKKMENNEANKNFHVLEEEHARDARNGMLSRRQTSPINNRGDNQDHDNENDDDDVIVDMEKESISHVDIRPVTPNIPSAANTPTPFPRIDVKPTHEERSNPIMNIDNSSVTNNQEISKKTISKSLMNTEADAFDLKIPMTDGENELIDATNNVVNYETRLFDDNSAKIAPSTFTGASLDALVTSPMPMSLTPSPNPISGIMGYDNGKLRSLSPNSNKSLSPAPPCPPSPSTSSKIPSTSLTPIAVQSLSSSSENLESADRTENELAESVVMAMRVVPEKFGPLRTPTPKDPHMKSTTFTHSIESGDGDVNGTNSTVQSTPLTTNGVGVSPTKKLPTKLKENDKSKPAGSPVKSPTKSIKSLPRTPELGPPSTVEKKKVPMNKVQVGAAPSPNLKTVRSKIGSLDNTSYKPGGGKVKIENRKLDFSKAQPKIAAKNDKYAPSGGDKKITQVKLQWNAKPKVGSLDNATYKPGGGDKKIETVKLDFKDKAKPKVGSKDNAKHIPGGGTVKSTVTTPKSPQEISNIIETQKIDIKAESKVGSMDNLKHKPGGGDKKIFNDRDYLRQTSSNVESVNGSGAQSPVPSIDSKNGLPTSDENLNQEY